MPQYAFKSSMFNVSAIHINSRVLPRFSSTHEPSDPPSRITRYGHCRTFVVSRRRPRVQSGVARSCEQEWTFRPTSLVELREPDAGRLLESLEHLIGIRANLDSEPSALSSRPCFAPKFAAPN
jgi:hypothetical protein